MRNTSKNAAEAWLPSQAAIRSLSTTSSPRTTLIMLAPRGTRLYATMMFLIGRGCAILMQSQQWHGRVAELDAIDPVAIVRLGHKRSS